MQSKHTIIYLNSVYNAKSNHDGQIDLTTDVVMIQRSSAEIYTHAIPVNSIIFYVLSI